MVVKNREEALKIVDNDVKEFFGKLFSARIFFRGPIIKDVETVAIFSQDAAECMMWIENKTKFYRKAEIPFVVYSNYEYYDSEGTLDFNWISKWTQKFS